MSDKKIQPMSYSVKGAAEAIGVSVATVWRRIALHEIPTFKLGARTLIRADALQSFIDQKSVTQ